jgi:post-segregation antitoxin (ccd killing protein)
MSRVQVYLPDSLHTELRRRILSASKLLQDALEREIRRAALVREIDRHLAQLRAKYGPLPRRERAAAEA